MFKHHYKQRVLAIALAVSSLSSFAGQAQKKLLLNTEQQLAMGMKMVVAQQVNQVPSAIYSAQASLPLKTIRSISSPLSGQIIKLNYVHGLVKKGAIVVEIESPELLKMQENFLTNLSNLGIKKQNLVRARKLNQSGISSTKKLQHALSEVKKLNLKKIQIKQSLTLMGMTDEGIKLMEKQHKLQAAILQIKAPINGQLFDLQVRLGERVAKNQNLISLGETNPIILIVRVPVTMVNELKNNQQVDIVGMKKQGEIHHIDLMVDPMTQSVDVHIQVENKDNKLRSGQLFKIRFLTSNEKHVYQVSANAISQYEGQSVVFLHKDNGIDVLPISVVNITQKTLYFIPKVQQPSSMSVYIQGTTAIKAALDAMNNDAAE
jgi:multidrug efflux pump subunit AcrA (membrane-fusion protein)